MFSTSTDLQQESFRIKHDEKFFSRLLSKESSKANPSFRVYYGDVSSGVPFMWESRPGTPKYTFPDDSLPPLTPPPSYYINNSNKSMMKRSGSKLLNALFMKIHHKKSLMLPSSPSSSSSSLSSLSWSSSSHSSLSGTIRSTPSNSCKRRRFLSWGSSFDERADRQEEASDGSCTPGMCLGFKRNQSSGVRGGYSVVMKKALLSIVGRSPA